MQVKVLFAYTCWLLLIIKKPFQINETVFLLNG